VGPVSRSVRGKGGCGGDLGWSAGPFGSGPAQLGCYPFFCSDYFFYFLFSCFVCLICLKTSLFSFWLILNFVTHLKFCQGVLANQRVLFGEF
jgi:hypothetical protein